MPVFDYQHSLDNLIQRAPQIRSHYEARVQNYILREHTINVCNEFEKYFANSFDELDIDLFRIILLLHDLGKPIAHRQGRRHQQHEITLQILSENAETLGLTKEAYEWAELLLSNDLLGQYVQGKSSATIASARINSLAHKHNIDPERLFYLLTVYYQCDAGSYTKDAGGLPFLEKLFSYDNGRKVYDPALKLLRFNQGLQARFVALKELVAESKNRGMDSDPSGHITFIRGNIFNSKCQTIVNTVNCVGAMGKGIALVHKLRHPQMYEAYKKHCSDGLIKPGSLYLYKETGSEPWILNFPTKNHWKYPSKVEYIEAGLRKFAATWEAKGIRSIAFPLLGTHNGGLDANTVKDLMYEYLSTCALPIEIYDYDPEANDGMFDRFQKKWIKASDKEIKESTGIQSQYIVRINGMIASGEISSMIALANCNGIGQKTLGKVFEFAKSEPIKDVQPDLFQDDHR